MRIPLSLPASIMLIIGQHSIANIAEASPWRNGYFGEAKALLEAPSDAIKESLANQPESYEFKSRFSSTSKSSVDYLGQSFRMQTAEEAMKLFLGLKASGFEMSCEDAKSIFSSYFDFKSDAFSPYPEFATGQSEFKVKPLGTDGVEWDIFEGTVFDDMLYPGKSLREKTAGNDNPLRRGTLKGWGSDFLGVDLMSRDADGKKDAFVEPEDFLAAIFEVLAARSVSGDAFQVGRETIDEAYLTKEGLDLVELFRATYLGSVAFSQAAEDYLSLNGGSNKGLNVPNDQPASPGGSYSPLEHHFDEGYGYFASSRDLLAYDHEWLKSNAYHDTNNDGLISFAAEKNYVFVHELSQLPSGHELLREIQTSFIKGRHLIATTPEGYRDYVKNLAVVLLGTWEKGFMKLALAAMNDLEKQRQLLGTPEFSFKTFARSFSRLKGYAMVPQYSPVAILSDAGFDKLHELLGELPPLSHDRLLDMSPDQKDAFGKRLLEAKELIQSAYEL